MNIIMVCESALVSGGAEKVAIQESIELRKRGYRVGYLTANDQADEALISAGAEVLLLNTKSFFEETDRKAKLQKMLFNAGIEKQVRDFLSTFEPQKTIVHLHTFRLRLSGIVAKIAQELGFSTLVHGHDYSPVCPTSLLYDHRMQANCERRPMSLSCIACECQNQSWKYKLPKLTSFYWNQSVAKINTRSNGFLHISDLEKITLRARTKAKVPDYSVLPISASQSSRRVEVENNQNFLFIGRITHEKGVESFLNEAKSANAQAVVIGDGPQLNDLKAKHPEARFTDWLDAAQIDQELSNARALVVPSVWRETLCLSVLDAMQKGVPCIVSENVGAKEYIHHEHSGLIYSSGQLKEAIYRLQQADFAKALSQGAYLTLSESPFTIERHVDELVKVYEQVMSK